MDIKQEKEKLSFNFDAIFIAHNLNHAEQMRIKAIKDYIDKRFTLLEEEVNTKIYLMNKTLMAEIERIKKVSLAPHQKR